MARDIALATRHFPIWGVQRHHFDAASKRDFTVSQSQDTQGRDLLGGLLLFSPSADSRHSKAKSATEVSDDVKTYGNQEVQHEKQGCARCKDCDASGSVTSTFDQSLAYVHTWRVALLLTSGPFYLHGMESHLKLGQPPLLLVTILNKGPKEANVIRSQKTRRSSKSVMEIGQIPRQPWRRLSFSFLGQREVTGKTETRPVAVCELWLHFWGKLRLASRIWFGPAGPTKPHFNMICQSSLKPSHCTSSLQSIVLLAFQIHCFGLLQSGVAFLALQPLRGQAFKAGQ